MRKLTAAVLAGAMTFGALIPTTVFADSVHGGAAKRPKYEVDFKDWQRDFWANESLARMITRGVIKGNGDATIASNRPVTRLEAAIMVSRLLELEEPEIPEGEFKLKSPWGELVIQNKKNKFEIKIKTRSGEYKLEDSGLIPDWGRAAILIGLREGFLIFDGDSLNPMKPLSRLEAAIMMVKAAGLDEEAQERRGADLDFKDEKKIPEQYRGYIAVAVENGFITGYDDGTFRPDQTLTRAEWAALLDRLDRTHGPVVTADGKQIKAVVTDVDDDSISVITPVYPGGVTYEFDDAVVFYKNRKEIDWDEIQVDDQVIINLDTEREVILLTVANVVRTVSGVVKDFRAPTNTRDGSIELKEKDGTNTYKVTADTRVLVSGQKADFDDVREGDSLTLKLEGSRATEISIKVETKTVTGILEDIDFGDDDTLPTLKIKTSEGVFTYSVADHAVFKNARGREITIKDLKEGDRLTVKLEKNKIVLVELTK